MLDQYVVVARIADGAMGRVYEARHRGTRARAAIKILHANVAQDARWDATVLQTVGSKGYDGFALLRRTDR